MTNRAVVLHSGGMDSTTLLYHVAMNLHADEIHALSVNYGQRHVKEIAAAHRTILSLNDVFGDNRVIRQHVDITAIIPLIRGSALTDEFVDVPEGHYTAESMKATVVPNRNMILIALAGALAIRVGGATVYTATHAGDHAIYPDCRPEFIDAVDVTLMFASVQDDGTQLARLAAPFINETKAEIAALGNRLGVPFELTWSCYKGEDIHCGRCATCVERLEAMHAAGVNDATEYADGVFWAAAVEAQLLGQAITTP